MKEYLVYKYNSELKTKWDKFINESINGTFLFRRSYMDYHQDRFDDYSLIIEDTDTKEIRAVFPANVDAKMNIYSHQGLTYGGIIKNHLSGTSDIINILKHIVDFYKHNDIKNLYYKAIPFFYHKKTSQEDLYALFINGFKLIRRDVTSLINLKNHQLKGKKKNGAKKCYKIGYQVVESQTSKTIMDIFAKNLSEKYNLKPTHSFKELDYLKSQNNEIVFFEIKNSEGIINGGSIVYLCSNCIHIQYLCVNQKGKSDRCQDLMISYLYEKFKNTYDYLDYGISTEDKGMILNEKLIKSKESFNLTAAVYDLYSKSL